MEALSRGQPNLNYNTEKKPLEEIFLSVEDNGSFERVPALAARFATPRCMTLYFPPPKREGGKGFIMGAKEDWLLQTKMCIEDFEWLLGLNHYRFWSQFVFQRNTCESLVSFLQEAYPFYALDQLPNDKEVKSAYHNIAALVFSLIVRLTTRVESETEWIGEKKYASLIYDKFLISIPMLLDVCVLYGPANEAEIRRIIERVFEIQPRYRDDFVKCVHDVKNIYNQSVDKISGGCGHLSEYVINENTNITARELDDILFFLMDVTISVSTFADMFPDAAAIMHQHHLEAIIVSTFQKIIDSVLIHIKSQFRERTDTISHIEDKLNILRYYLLKLFRQCINTSLTALVEKREELTPEAVNTFAESYLAVMADALLEKQFVKDYNILFPVRADVELLNQICPDVETDHLLNSVESLYEDFEKWTQQDAPQSHAGGVQKGPRDQGPSTSSQVFTGVELESLITDVKDILPHLGEGFVQKCLEHFNYSSSAVINAVLENTLPDILLTMDPDLPFIPEESVYERNNLPERVNVFDNDEFDIMTKDYIDPSKVHKGKRKDKFTDLTDMLDDKTHREDLRDVYTKLGNVEYLDDVYDDEYDDTYDSVDVTLEETEDPEKRPFVVPRVLRHNNDERNTYDNEDEQSEPSDHEETQPPKFEGFVEDPEVVRSRFEAMRLSKGLNRGKDPPRPRDVVGKGKGQGQEKDVLVNRQKKGANKSSHGNHNRRRKAQNKRQQGMLHL